jgi:hypothetical protein
VSDPAAKFAEVQDAVKKVLNRWKIGSAGDYSTMTHREVTRLFSHPAVCVPPKFALAAQFPYAFRLRVRTLLLVAVRLGVVLPKDVKVLLGRALVSCEGEYYFHELSSFRDC